LQDASVLHHRWANSEHHSGPVQSIEINTFKGFNSLLRHWVGEPHRSPYRPDIETDEGIRFIEANANRPWFLYQSYYAPHEPLDPPREWASKFTGQADADYHATIANLDCQRQIEMSYRLPFRNVLF
jgi:arylsulfatase A-like enzyme